MECRSTSHESVIKRVTDVEKASQSRALNNTVGHAEMFALGGRRAGVWNRFERNVLLMFTIHHRPVGPAAFQINQRILRNFQLVLSLSPPRRKYLISLTYDAEQLLPPLSLMQVINKKRRSSAKGSLARSSSPLPSLHSINFPRSILL